jgi:YcaO-like protein with predicted kinase domain
VKLKPSPKIYNNFKCAHPENIIKRIEDGFKKIGFEFSYLEKKIRSKNYEYINAMVKIKGMGGIAEGGSFSPISAKASAYAEMAERFSSREIAFYAFPSFSNIPKYNEILRDILEMNFLKGYTKICKDSDVNYDSIKKYIKESLTENQYNIIKNQLLLDTLVDAYSFIDNKYRKIPIKLVEVMSASNGVASGGTIEEALVQASCEIFERYTGLEVVTKQIECQTIDINSIQDENIQKFVDMFKSMNIEMIFKDLSISKKLPVVGILFINHNVDDENNKLKKDRFFKKLIVSSHPNLKTALMGCFSEYIQLESDQDDLQFGRKADYLYEFWTKKLEKKYAGPNKRYNYFFHYYDYFGSLLFLEKGKKIKFCQLNNMQNNDSLDDFKHIIKVCKYNNWDLLAIDYTHRIIKIPTIRVVIPPISTDYNPDVKKALDFKDFKERFNYFYDINNFYDYYYDDSWINDKKSINSLIVDLEDYLSRNLFYYHVWIYLGIYHQFVNIFYILAFAYLSLGNYNMAFEYFNILYQLENKPDFNDEYSDIIFNYDPGTIFAYLCLLEKAIKNKEKLIDFVFKTNPFKREKIGFENSEYLFTTQLKNVNNSFNFNK